MKDLKAIDYQEWANEVQKKLDDDQTWVGLYENYAKQMIKNKDAFLYARRKFRVRKPLHAYLTIGKAKDKSIQFDLRYLGQSVGTISVKGDNVLLSVSEKQDTNSKNSFGYTIGQLSNVDWKTNKNAKLFREFFGNDSNGLPRQKEHLVESALFSETEKNKSIDKTLCNITPVSYAGTRIHMKTAVTASGAKGGNIAISDKGGEIDLLCRRSIKAGKGESRLVVIEIKDENKKTESFDLTMKQALAYAVFVRELIHSSAGEHWMELWGMKNQAKTDFIIECAVAMPKGQTKFNYERKRIEFKYGNNHKDIIELHFMELIDINPENVRFNHSF